MGDSKIEQDSTEVVNRHQGGERWVAKIDHGLEVPIIRDFKIQRQDGNENFKENKTKNNRFNEQQQLCTCITPFCVFLCRFCTTTTSKCLI